MCDMPSLGQTAPSAIGANAESDAASQRVPVRDSRRRRNGIASAAHTLAFAVADHDLARAGGGSRGRPHLELARFGENAAIAVVEPWIQGPRRGELASAAGQ